MTAHPTPMINGQRRCGETDIVKIGSKHIAAPTPQYQFEPSAQTIPKKCRPTMIEIIGSRNWFRWKRTRNATASRIKTASNATETV
ncbi:MAG: hypothetical protein IRY93_01460 [Chthoniobacterales bacterium]|nr:hypothetical protein [Chthoniobacterales bacterium]